MGQEERRREGDKWKRRGGGLIGFERGSEGVEARGGGGGGGATGVMAWVCGGRSWLLHSTVQTSRVTRENFHLFTFV